MSRWWTHLKKIKSKIPSLKGLHLANQSLEFKGGYTSDSYKFYNKNFSSTFET